MRLTAALTATVILGGCEFHPDRHWRFREDTNANSKLVFDSLELRRLIAEQESRNQELPEPIPGRSQFLDAVRRQPGVSVPPGPYARQLERSKASCEPGQSKVGRLTRIRITTGPLKGMEGWVCEHYDIGLTLAMP
jgi:hypothetical protein